MTTPCPLRTLLTRYCLIVVLLAWPALGQAGVTRLVIDSTQPAQGPAFAAMPYEVLQGRAFGELDPRDRRNAIITDLNLAPRNARGLVEYEATFTLWKPVDLSKASGLLMYGVSNRGGGVNPADYNVARGDVFLNSGWQGDIAFQSSAQTIRVPVARNPDGSSVTGIVLARFPQTTASPTLALPGQRTPASLDPALATLTRRASEESAVVPIAATDWAFADARTAAFPGTPDPTRISLRGGFQAGQLYELTYTAKDPLVLGVGLAATRDLNAFFRRAAKDATGQANPVAGRITHAIAQGDSQSGNFIKTFLHLGFNEDESGKIVWDGANPHIAARQNPLNFRFALPGGATAPYEPGSEPVLWWGSYRDEARQRPAATLLDRAKASRTVPKILETFGAAEFWGLRMSPGLVGTRADIDIPLPANVRRYYFPGTTHGGGRGGFNVTPRSSANAYGLAGNPNPQNETMRALRLALIDWVMKGKEPPPSRYPRLDRGELVLPEAAAMGFPSIPGVALPDRLINPIYDYDFGPGFNHNDLSGIMRQPPVIRRIIPQLVPRVDADGNEVAGVPSVLHQVPLGSYLGWSVTLNGFYKDRQSGFQGSFIPFAVTKAERLASGDPRPSLEERYGTHDKYVALVRAAAAKAVAERFLFQADADRLIQQAEAGDVLNPNATPPTPADAQGGSGGRGGRGGRGGP
ncbi:MAG: hypothetical protein RL324_1411 [Verrucomicrobiota bacterium]|jgi:hypothetical protein